MHREMEGKIEDVLAGAESAHLAECDACRSQVDGMREQAALVRELRPPQGADLDPRPGFYARVMERIEAEGPISIWNLFFESAFGRRIAVASLALALLVGIYLVTAERSAEDPIVADQSAVPAQLAASNPAISPAASDDEIQTFMLQQMQRQMEQMQQFAAGQTVNGPSPDDAMLANLVTYQEQ